MPFIAPTVLLLAENPLSSFSDIAMVFEMYNSYVNEIDLSETPLAIEKGADFKKELLIQLGIQLWNLKKLNGEEVVQEDHEEAKIEREERKKAEEEKLREEQEAREREEAEKRAAEAEAEALAAEAAAAAQ